MENPNLQFYIIFGIVSIAAIVVTALPDNWLFRKQKPKLYWSPFRIVFAVLIFVSCVMVLFGGCNGGGNPVENNNNPNNPNIPYNPPPNNIVNTPYLDERLHRNGEKGAWITTGKRLYQNEKDGGEWVDIEYPQYGIPGTIFSPNKLMITIRYSDSDEHWYQEEGACGWAIIEDGKYPTGTVGYPGKMVMIKNGNESVLCDDTEFSSLQPWETFWNDLTYAGPWSNKGYDVIGDTLLLYSENSETRKLWIPNIEYTKKLDPRCSR